MENSDSKRKRKRDGERAKDYGSSEKLYRV